MDITYGTKTKEGTFEMPPKTVTCFICNQEVSKRLTLALGDKRACRNHDEVKSFLSEQEAQQQAQSEKRQWQKVERKLQVLGLATHARMLHSMYGVPEFVLASKVRMDGGAELWKEVKAEIDRQGGLVVSEREIGESVAMAIYMASKLKQSEKS